jgi:hypothetical protein
MGDWRDIKYDHEPKGSPFTEGEDFKYGVGGVLLLLTGLGLAVGFVWSLLV